MLVAPSVANQTSYLKGVYHFSKPEFCLGKTPRFNCHAFSGMDVVAESLDGPVVLPFLKPKTIENQTPDSQVSCSNGSTLNLTAKAN